MRTAPSVFHGDCGISYLEDCRVFDHENDRFSYVLLLGGHRHKASTTTVSIKAGLFVPFEQVSTAYGPFWGWMEGYCSWVSGVADNSLCKWYREVARAAHRCSRLCGRVVKLYRTRVVSDTNGPLRQLSVYGCGRRGKNWPGVKDASHRRLFRNPINVSSSF